MLAVALALAAALAVMLFLLPSGENETKESPEEELTEICSSLSGVGRCRAVICYGEGGSVSAVAVLCEGADSVFVRERITELITSLYGIGANRIAVLKID